MWLPSQHRHQEVLGGCALANMQAKAPPRPRSDALLLSPNIQLGRIGGMAQGPLSSVLRFPYKSHAGSTSYGRVLGRTKHTSRTELRFVDPVASMASSRSVESLHRARRSSWHTAFAGVTQPQACTMAQAARWAVPYGASSPRGDQWRSSKARGSRPCGQPTIGGERGCRLDARKRPRYNRLLPGSSRCRPWPLVQLGGL